MDENKIKHLEQIMKLMKQYQVDHVEIDGVKVNKAYHDFTSPEDKSTKEVDDEEALFYSAD